VCRVQPRESSRGFHGTRDAADDPPPRLDGSVVGELQRIELDGAAAGGTNRSMYGSRFARFASKVDRPEKVNAGSVKTIPRQLRCGAARPEVLVLDEIAPQSVEHQQARQRVEGACAWRRLVVHVAAEHVDDGSERRDKAAREAARATDVELWSRRRHGDGGRGDRGELIVVSRCSPSAGREITYRCH